MLITRRALTTLLCSGAAFGPVLMPGVASAAYPDRPVRLIVPFAAGGNADIQGRIIAEQMRKVLSQPVVVENRGGAGGGIGAEFVARVAPDGYTLLIGSNGPMTVNPIIQNTNYDTFKDFAPVALVSYVPHVLIVHPKVSAGSVTEFVALSKAEELNIGVAGIGSATHMTLERFKAAMGARISAVPYRSGGALAPDLIGGTIHGAFTEISTGLPLHKQGLGKIIAITADKRHPDAPDIATMIEEGANITAESFIGVLAPAQTPKDVLAILEQAIVRGMTDSVAIERVRGLGAVVASPERLSAVGLADYLKMDYERMLAAANRAGLKRS
jgi:tripartite-type tricarboxylate transporter receptor subunit TctC